MAINATFTLTLPGFMTQVPDVYARVEHVSGGKHLGQWLGVLSIYASKTMVDAAEAAIERLRNLQGENAQAINDATRKASADAEAAAAAEVTAQQAMIRAQDATRAALAAGAEDLEAVIAAENAAERTYYAAVHAAVEATRLSAEVAAIELQKAQAQAEQDMRAAVDACRPITGEPLRLQAPYVPGQSPYEALYAVGKALPQFSDVKDA